MVRKISLWIKYSIKTFRADLKIFLIRHLAKATLETISVLLYLFYVKKTIVYVYI